MAILGVLIYVAYAGALFALQDRLIYPRFMVAPDTHVQKTLGVTRLERTIPGGTVHAWLLDPIGARDEANRQAPAPLVVYFHGNAESASDNFARVRHYRDAGFAVLLPEYRGYAGAAGTPTQVGLIEDAEWFIDAMKDRPRVDATRLVLHGRSLGGGVAAQIAARRLPAALILESSFTSVARFARGKLVPEFLVRSPYRTDAVLATLDCPVLILHGTEDTIIPVEHARAIAKLARHATLVEMAGNHNDFPLDEAAYWRAIDEVIEKAVK